MTVSYAELRAAFAQIRAAMQASSGPDWQGAQVLGVNAEGPFINPAKKGAQAEENIRPGDALFAGILGYTARFHHRPGDAGQYRTTSGRWRASA